MSNKSILIRALAIGFVMIALSDRVSADLFDDLEVHGFATQGFIKTSGNKFFGDSENGSFDFRELGINASWEPVDRLRISGQLLSRKAGSDTSESPNVDFLLADLVLVDSAESNLSVQLGRLKNPIGMFNETRDIAFTRPSVLLPQGVYFDKARALMRSSDGMGFHFSTRDTYANYSFLAAVGYPISNNRVESAFLGTEFEGSLIPRKLSFVSNASVVSKDETLRGSVSLASTKLKFERSESDPLPDGEVDVVFWILSLQYSNENWSLTAEYMREPVRWNGFSGTFFSGRSTDIEGYYVQLDRNISSVSQLFIRYEESFLDRADHSGLRFEKSTFGYFPADSAYSKIWALGARWDLAKDIVVFAEYQRHDGTFILSNTENPLSVPRESSWDLFALSLSYRF